MNTRTCDEFIHEATTYWGGSFNYSLVNAQWKNNTTAVPITCNACGHQFKTTPVLHCSSHRHTGCRSCTSRQLKTLSFDEYIKKATLISGNTFDFSKSLKITNTTDKINVICRTCGTESFIRAKNLTRKNPTGCANCQRLNTKIRMSNTKTDIEHKLRSIFGDKYSLVSDGYNTSTTLSSIQCNVCNEIHDVRIDHVYRSGIPCKCKYKFKLTQQDFISNAIQKHANRYTYGDVVYCGYRVPVMITCKLHGSFTVTPESHMMGTGCHACSSSKGELLIAEWLTNNNINYTRQHRYNDCKHKNTLPFDFYLPNYNMCIEYNGEQHYKPTRFNGMTHTKAGAAYDNQKLKDSIKETYCRKNNINLLIIPYWEKHNIDIILNTEINKNGSP